VPAHVDGEITGIAVAVASAGSFTARDLNFSVIHGGVIIYEVEAEADAETVYINLDANHLLMHFHVLGYFKHMVDNDRLRVQFRWGKASYSRSIKSCGVHLIRRYEEKKIDLINDNQVTKRPRVDDGNLESNWYQHQKRHSSTLGSRFSNAKDMQPGES
jgi:hypothetical protein